MKKTVETLLMNLEEPLLILDEECQVSFMNGAARESGLSDVQPGMEPDVRRAARQLREDDEPGIVPCVVSRLAGTLSARLIRLERGYALLFSSQDRAGSDASLDNLLMLTREQLVVDMGGFLGKLHTLMAHLKGGQMWISGVDEAWLVDCMETGSLITQRMDNLLQMVSHYGHEPLRASERLILGELLEDVLAGLDEILAQRRIAVELLGFDKPIGSLYGSRVWMERALRECLLEVLEHVPAKGSLIRIKATQHGAFVAISIVPGMPGPGRGDALGATYHQIASSGRQRPAGSLGLTLATKVIGLLGGHLRVLDNGIARELLLELPTGGVTEENGLDPRQVEEYARALSELLRRRAVPGASIAEGGVHKPADVLATNH